MNLKSLFSVHFYMFTVMNLKVNNFEELKAKMSVFDPPVMPTELSPVPFLDGI